jgi:hypothetical protein
MTIGMDFYVTVVVDKIYRQSTEWTVMSQYLYLVMYSYLSIVKNYVISVKVKGPRYTP